MQKLSVPRPIDYVLTAYHREEAAARTRQLAMSASATLVPALNSTVPPTHDSAAISASSAVSPSSSNPTVYPHPLPHSSPTFTAASTASSLAAFSSNILNNAHSLPPLPAPGLLLWRIHPSHWVHSVLRAS